MSLVGGMITVTGASFILFDKIQNYHLSLLLFIITIFIIICLLLIYRKSANYANIARNVASDLEINKDSDVGVSDVFKNIDKVIEYKKYKAKKSIFKGIYGIVHLIFIFLLTSLILTAYITFPKHFLELNHRPNCIKYCK